MQLDLNESEARLIRALIVRHLVELEEELARADGAALHRALSSRLHELRELHDRLTLILEPAPRSTSSPSVPVVVPVVRPA
jgi:hypothetical protein